MTEQDKNVYLMLGTDAEKKRPSVVCGEVNNAIYAMKMVAESYGVVFSDAVIDQLYNELDEHFIQVMKDSAFNIRAYHEKQKRNSWFDAKEDGTILGQKITPMQNVGVYVPGGKAAYPSTTLMNVVPAKVAGVTNIIMTTPAGAVIFTLITF